MEKLSTRLGGNWLVLTAVREHTWHLRVLGDTPLEAEVTADDEEEAKDRAIVATMERLSIGPFPEPPTWNITVSTRWDSRDDR